MDGIVREASAATTANVVELAAAGDTVAFARIVAAYHEDMIRVAYVVGGGSQDIADDAVQAAWSIAWRKLASIRDPERLKAWLVTVAANEARQLCRHERRTAIVALDLSLPGGDVADPSEPDPADRADGLDLERAIHRLDPGERTLLALRYEAGLDSTEIGRLTNRPAATVRWRLSRLVHRLRTELSDA